MGWKLEAHFFFQGMEMDVFERREEYIEREVLPVSWEMENNEEISVLKNTEELVNFGKNKGNILKTGNARL